MEEIEKIIKKTNEKNQKKINWTKAWSEKYPILKTYQSEVNVSKYANEIRKMLDDIKNTYGYTDEDSMLVLKDILAHEYLDKGN